MPEADQTTKTVSTFPARHGAVPTADGVFPVEYGGRRKKRAAHIDVEAFDLKAMAHNAEIEQDNASREIAAILADEADPLHPYVKEIGIMAPVIRPTDLLASARLRNAPIIPEIPPVKVNEPALASGGELPASVTDEQRAEFARQLAGPTPKEHALRWLNEATDAKEFVTRLSSMSNVRAQSILGDHWNGEEDAFEAACQALWDARQPAKVEAPDAPDTKPATTSPAAPKKVEPNQVPDPPKPAKKTAQTNKTKP